MTLQSIRRRVLDFPQRDSESCASLQNKHLDDGFDRVHRAHGGGGTPGLQLNPPRPRRRRHPTEEAAPTPAAIGSSSLVAIIRAKVAEQPEGMSILRLDVAQRSIGHRRGPDLEKTTTIAEYCSAMES